ncbi:hypothetical protein WV31_09810 [Magnetospirillum sp. ME-1]|nr:hypothetical protein WV31_09810 [Magnetospirillum sp. ME-1]
MAHLGGGMRASNLPGAEVEFLPRLSRTPKGFSLAQYAHLHGALVQGGLPWRPMLTETLLAEILAQEPSCHQTKDHRVLKVHARLLAVANDPRGQLEPEAAATSGRYPLRADLIVWHANGVSESYECGATDGRSIIEQLQDGQVRVTILPFAGLSMPFIHGYAFRLSENPPPRPSTVEDGMRAWAEILAARPSLPLPFRLSMSI